AIYSNLNVNKNKFSSDESIKATVDIENNSYYSGIETVQLYIQDMFASVVQPEKNLKAFQQIYLSAHEKRRVTFTINVEMLKFYNTNLDYIAEPGDFKLYIGKNSQDVLETNFTLLG
ncbi:fibronectin type III-like domain-contianing protein, partial [Oenococcus oeni]